MDQFEKPFARYTISGNLSTWSSDFCSPVNSPTVDPYIFIPPTKMLFLPGAYMDQFEKPYARYTISGNLSTWSSDFCSPVNSPLVDPYIFIPPTKMLFLPGAYMDQFEKPYARYTISGNLSTWSSDFCSPVNSPPVDPYIFIPPTKMLFLPGAYMDQFEKPYPRYTISGNLSTWSSDFCSPINSPPVDPYILIYHTKILFIPQRCIWTTLRNSTIHVSAIKKTE